MQRRVSRLTKVEEVVGQTAFAQIVVGQIQYFQRRQSTEATGQTLQAVHSKRNQKRKLEKTTKSFNIFVKFLLRFRNEMQLTTSPCN